MNTRIKICGITNSEDALLAANAGADAIGLIFYEKSPRFVNIEQAQKILAHLPPFISVVGVFVDAPVSYVENILAKVPLDLLQFHGKESGDYCRQFQRPYIKAIAMNEDVNWNFVQTEYADAKAFLLDTSHAGQPGGTGKTFAWEKIPQNLTKPIILAGGLNPENIAKAIAQVKPYAVDVTSGVEKSKGKKDPQKINDFIKNANAK